MVKQGVESLNHIIETLGPLGREERQTALAKLTLTNKLYKDAQSDDPTVRGPAIQALFGHSTQAVLDPYTRAHQAELGRQSARPPKQASNVAQLVADAARRRAAAASGKVAQGMVNNGIEKQTPRTDVPTLLSPDAPPYK